MPAKQVHVELAYLFGSVALQKAGKLSDVDIAIFFNQSLGKKDKFNIKLKLISDLEDILKIDRLDLIMMNDAPISLNFEIIKANHPLFIRDKDLKVDLEHYIMSRYLDRQYYGKRWADNFIKKRLKTKEEVQVVDSFRVQVLENNLDELHEYAKFIVSYQLNMRNY